MCCSHRVVRDLFADILCHEEGRDAMRWLVGWFVKGLHPLNSSQAVVGSGWLLSGPMCRNKKEADAEFRRLQTQNPSVEDGAAVCRFSPLTAAYRDSKLYVVDP